MAGKGDEPTQGGPNTEQPTQGRRGEEQTRAAQRGDEPTRIRQPDPPQQAASAQAMPSPGFGITAMVLGIIGVFVFWIPFFGWILPVLALIFGIIGAVMKSGRGMAIAGIVLGGLEIFGIVLMLIFGALTFGSAVDDAIDEYQRQQERMQQQQQQDQGKPPITY